jgi:hypothetical protein
MSHAVITPAFTTRVNSGFRMVKVTGTLIEGARGQALLAVVLVQRPRWFHCMPVLFELEPSCSGVLVHSSPVRRVSKRTRSDRLIVAPLFCREAASPTQLMTPLSCPLLYPTQVLRTLQR